MLPFPEGFIRTQTDLHGPAGLVWLRRLPDILAACARRWDLTLGLAVESLSYNYVAHARRADGTPVMLKVCTPTGEFRAEAGALAVFDGHGAVRLLEIDRDDQVMLLEACAPGTSLTTVEDDRQATSIAATVMRRLWQPAPPEHPFPTVADWGRGFERMRAHFGGGSGPFPAPLTDRAERLFVELEASMAGPVVLHGDLHHDNILAAAREPWLVIDPKGLVGEPAYEVGALLRNRLPEPLTPVEAGGLLARRVDQLSEELGLERARVAGWAMAQAVLSAWWTVEDHGQGWEETIACAELLAAITP
jgi:streptomycin 6-kinase